MKKFSILFGFAALCLLFSCGEPATQTATTDEMKTSVA
ncbi:MAG: hypothetical protein ACI9JY_000677, partial [Saprospiraceae bacterium]